MPGSRNMLEGLVCTNRHKPTVRKSCSNGRNTEKLNCEDTYQ